MGPPPTLDELLAIAEDAVRAGAEAAMHFVGREVATHSKDGEPVTEADLAAHDEVCRALATTALGYPIISEEDADDAGARAQGGPFWVLDPIDGTVEFLGGTQHWAVQLGLVVGGRAILGVVCQPATGFLWRGRDGRAERLELTGGDPTPIGTSACCGLDDAVLARSGTRKTSSVNRLAACLGIHQFVDLGGAGAKAMKVAEGAADLYLVTGERTKIWDLCAPEAIVRAAGGEVTDLTGAPLDYQAPELANLRGAIVSNRLLHGAVVTGSAEIIPQL